MSQLSDLIKNNPPVIIDEVARRGQNTNRKLCSRCGKELRGQVYMVAGFDGIFGHQCALQVCQGNARLIRKTRVILQGYDGPLPF